MARDPALALPCEPRSVHAFNEDSNTVNRIHADDVAKAHGFDGALVSGAWIFGHVSELLTGTYGAAWLSRAELVMRLLRPAYDGDQLTLNFARDFSPEAERDTAQRLTCHNQNNELLSTLDFSSLAVLPAPGPLSRCEPPGRKPVRRQILWNAVRPGEAFPEVAWTPGHEENITCAGVHAEDTGLWETGLVHPRLWLDLANRALTNRFIMPAWLHLETRIILREALRTGREYRILATPEMKWRRRKSEYLRLYIAVLAGNSPHMEIWHTANFLIART